MVTKVYASEGSSTTAGVDVGGQSYSKIYSDAHPEVTFHNPTSGGETADTIAARAATVDAFLVCPAINILSLQPLGNISGAGADADLATLATYLAARRAAGWYTVLMTTTCLLNAGASVRAHVDPILRSWLGIYADELADVSADPILGDEANRGNPAYLGVGGHPTALSQSIMNSVMAVALNARFSTTRDRRIVKIGS